jgi:hypothetical protein
MIGLETETASVHIDERPDPDDLVSICRFCHALLQAEGYADRAQEIADLDDQFAVE